MIEAHAHRWRIENHEDGITRGECRVTGCEAIRFFPMEFTKHFIERANQLNKEIGNDFKIKPLHVTGGLEHFEEVSEMETQVAKPVAERYPVPEKPDTAGMVTKRMGKVLRRWYDENREAITAWFKEEGVKRTGEAWGITSVASIKLRKDWGLTIPAMGKGRNTGRQETVTEPEATEEATAKQETGSEELTIVDMSAEDQNDTEKTGATAKESLEAYLGDTTIVLTDEEMCRECIICDDLICIKGVLRCRLAKCKHGYTVAEAEERETVRLNMTNNEGRAAGPVPDGVMNPVIISAESPDKNSDSPGKSSGSPAVFPDFPEFDDGWPEAVQVEWLRIYGLIATEVRS